ncbi:unnamed protein product, partial [Tetraodon nigroviridis]
KHVYDDWPMACMAPISIPPASVCRLGGRAGQQSHHPEADLPGPLSARQRDTRSSQTATGEDHGDAFSCQRDSAGAKLPRSEKPREDRREQLLRHSVTAHLLLLLCCRHLSIFCSLPQHPGPHEFDWSTHTHTHTLTCTVSGTGSGWPREVPAEG